MKFVKVLLLVLVATGPLTAASLASPSSTGDRDDAPFAEAGLDQESTVGDRVLLDGGGSRAASGDIAEYDWSITGPNGTTVRPSCSTCVRTAFVPDRSGRYRITLTVTDASGRTDSDTMYVDADVADSPDVSISGPRRIASDRPAEFTATVRPGEAELTHLNWSVDGTSVDTATIDGDRTASLERTFTGAGTAQVNATVHDTAGRERTASRTVDVAAPAYTDSTSTAPSLSVRGPRVLTGEGPFEGEYRLVGDDVEDVGSVTWRDAEGERGSGTGLETEFEPGTHELTAFADVGGETYNTTFENGTSVVVDPRPDVSLTTSQTDDTLSGTVKATDEFGNLDSVELFVDDERVREWPAAGGGEFETSFSVALDEGQNSNRVRAVTTDERGQSVTETNETGDPELVRSGFVNGPVDSYDRRIDSDRYTAVHEAVIDLNGVDPSEVSPELDPSGSNPKLQKVSNNDRKYNAKDDELIITSYWAGEAPEEYLFSIESKHLENRKSGFRVTHSDPEPRIEVIDEGEDSEDKAHRLLIDVSDSFDPDGGSLEFRAQDRDRKPNDPDQIGLEFSDTPGLKIIDEEGNSVDLSSELYDYWSPEFKKVEEVSEGPYEPDDTIEFRVKTETFHLADRDYDPSLDLQLDGATGDVTEWKLVSHSSDAGPDPNPHETKHPQYVGTVEVTANSYLDRTIPYVKIANDKETTWESLPSVRVYEEQSLERSDLSITSLEYTQRELLEKTVTSQAAKSRLKAKGYRVTDTSKTLEEITIEKRQSLPPEVVDTRTFASRTERRRFLSSHPNWSPAGTTVQSQSTETTRWLDAPSPSRGYTGEKRTRRICSGSDAFMRGGRCVPFESTDTVTQYLHRYDEKEDKTMFVAEKMETRTHWDPIGVVSTPEEASSWSKHPGIRAGSRTYSREWEMEKSSDEMTVSDSYNDASEVIRTTATVEYDRQYSLRHGSNMHDTSAGPDETITVDQVSGTTTFEGFESREEILQSVESGERDLNPGCSIDEKRGC